MHKYTINYANHELDPIASDRKDGPLMLSSNQVYKVHPLPFDGVLAFDTEHAYLYLGNRRRCIEAVKLRTSLIVSSIVQVDPVDSKTFNQTATPAKGMLRFLIGTEQGEIYMIAFNLERIWQLLVGEKTLADVQQEAVESETAQVMVVEFMGARLSSCSSLLYLGGVDNYLFYSSTAGDSYILSIQSESVDEKDMPLGVDVLNPAFNQELGIVDRPYVKIEEEHQSLAPIVGLELRRNWNVSYNKRRSLTSSQAAASAVEDK